MSYLFLQSIIPPEPDATPSEIVTKFVSWNKHEYSKSLCYNLMSSEYRNLTDNNNFIEQLENCGNSWKYYKFMEVKMGSEKINGKNASLEIIYHNELKGNPLNKPENKTLTVDLIKEDDGWRLKRIYCELTG